MTITTKRIASYGERRKIEDVMIANSTKLYKKKNKEIRTWNEGWDFERAAKEVSPELRARHAKYIAEQMNWHFIDSDKQVPTMDNDLEHRVRLLEDRLHEVETIVNQLR